MTDKAPQHIAKSLQDAGLPLFHESFEPWVASFKHELSFWKHWITSKGGPWSEDWNKRLKTDRDFELSVPEPLRQKPLLKVLDVGAGPLTILGTKAPNQLISVIPIDPLADLYKILLKQASVIPPVTTQFGIAEAAAEAWLRLQEESNISEGVDIVHCRNALDHAFDPIFAILQCCSILSEQGIFLLFHYINEGERENYSGMHNWNFQVDERGQFIVWNRRLSWNITCLYGDILKIDAFQNRNFCQVTISPLVTGQVLRDITLYLDPDQKSKRLERRVHETMMDFLVGRED